MRLLGGPLRRHLGGATLRVPAARVDELLDGLVARGGPELAALLYDGQASRAPGRDLRVLVNGRGIAFLEGLATPLAEGDCVTLYLAGARGWPGG